MLCFSDLDDTLYPVSSGIGVDVMRNIQGTHSIQSVASLKKKIQLATDD
jgi:hypothetical protein